MSHQRHFYAVIFDAGSSGTRPFIYRITETGGSIDPFGKVVEVVNHDGKPLKSSAVGTGGIQRHRDDLAAYLNPLFDEVAGILERLPDARIIGRSPYVTIPVKYYLYATGGVRDRLNDTERGVLRTNLLSYIINTRRIAGSDFKYEVISGTDEAKYGWVAANRSQARLFDTGYVEMGGATAQIAFPLEDDYAAAAAVVRRMDGKAKVEDVGPYKLFLASYSLGSNAGYEKYKEALFGQKGRDLGLRKVENHQTIFSDPSKREGYPEKVSEDGIIRFRSNVGKSAGESNLAKTFHLMAAAYDLLFPDVSITDPLLPALRKLDFVGGANFWWSMYDALDAKGTFDLPAFYKCVKASSQIPHAKYKKRYADKPDMADIFDRSIFTAVWTLHVLKMAFGLQLKKAEGDTRKEMAFTPYNGGGADRNRFSWTLGVATLLASPDLRNLEQSPIRAPPPAA